jgi:membrane complex biogenesis BtpA family protein
VTSRFRALFPRQEKPLIAMAHLPALPGTPMYDREGGIDAIIKAVRVDLAVLLEAAFDAILFCNEGDRPYSFNAGYEGVAVMARVVTELAPQDRPFGVDFLWDARAALAIAIATGADFIREVATGVYESDMGLWATDAAGLLRERRRLDGDGLAIFMNVTPEFASSLGRRGVGEVAHSTVVSSLADAVLVSGPMAGAEPDLATVREAKEALGGRAPVLVNTGVKSSNIASFLEVADGAIVGSDLKVDGDTWNPVDALRVKRLMEAVGR